MYGMPALSSASTSRFRSACCDISRADPGRHAVARPRQHLGSAAGGLRAADRERARPARKPSGGAALVSVRGAPSDRYRDWGAAWHPYGKDSTRPGRRRRLAGRRAFACDAPPHARRQSPAEITQTNTSPGPCTPVTRTETMSAVALTPLMKLRQAGSSSPFVHRAKHVAHGGGDRRFGDEQADRRWQQRVAARHCATIHHHRVPVSATAASGLAKTQGA